MPSMWYFYHKCGSGGATWHGWGANQEKERRRWPRKPRKVHEGCDQYISLSPTGFTARVPRHQNPPGLSEF